MREQAAVALLGELTGAAKTPGLQYVAVDASGLRFEHSIGRADLAMGREMGVATTMMAYSMSKTITAVAVRCCASPSAPRTASRSR